MTVFLTIIVLALLAVTGWQMSKIFQLSQGNQNVGNDSEVANDKDNRINGYLSIMFLIFLYVISIYCFWNYSEFYLPEASSAHGADYDTLMFITIALIMFVQVITQFLLFYFSNKYAGKKGQRALFYADNDKLEFIWTIIPVVVLAGLILYGLFTWSDIMNVEETEDTMVVELYAYQFAWRARYSGDDNTLGKANVRYIEGINALGVDPSDNYGKDDVITTELHLPVNKPVLFKFRSQDVLHSAYMPFFRAQMNVVPGMITQFGFTPTVTSEDIQESEFMIKKVRKINEIRRENSKDLVAKGEEPLDSYEFEYYLLCNKICGKSHYNMQMKIVVESEEDFNAWMAEQKTLSEELSAQASN
ncbi:MULTISPECIES: cytochrome c oxidase subunit II [Croceibacter]|jgi:cytochrome c oxidase subunit 2|uniref:cytochrome-c oxidase n=1 Tax=Croceibacter atlanticus (strain ATCC BAA-628 / JCM 21780 / CIP 108009 / IAM 15332 / KCTC 12090 / HTCC2559) TaxID=216432 RepID=A3U529_CROAH|nr:MULTISPECIES: cytochrome c oxidase subunit II [Croceibacter]HAT70227.1 cytochrome c oxidase subunit II [Flavobacteriaceae bacterium]EAP87346.1 Cytochrome c oxidase, subunit II:Cytochrome c, class I [Croceibacter atlanticus HTCC2559]MAM22472.1 cytochrome C oxidase subunit II [Croceibacter sp.]MBG24489.1 cytochrome C oxidase subunit II [Croceibacter sp.]WSP34954.1 cytochrome c oxidase subunit II [Croceibacter atlanticus]|tara:strand:- start:548 stop:1627 length:1080 start_codon:yes stop_codon:yes gene_type:complete